MISYVKGEKSPCLYNNKIKENEILQDETKIYIKSGHKSVYCLCNLTLWCINFYCKLVTTGVLEFSQKQ